MRQRIEDSADRFIYEMNPDYESCNGNSGVDCLGKGMVDVYKAIGMDFSPNIVIDNLNIIPSGDDDVVQIVGHSVGEKLLFVQPSLTYLVVDA